jgi:hypothetical protein
VTTYCAFTTCNEAYVPQAIVALTAVRKWNPDVDLLVLSRGFSGQATDLLSRYGIGVVRSEIGGHFSDQWTYPAECFDWFDAPGSLGSAGYTHALYLDADVLCHGPLAVDTGEVHTICGVSNGSTRAILEADLPLIEAEIGTVPDVDRLQSGVLLMHLPALDALRFTQRAIELYRRCRDIGAPRKGDDSLLALLLALHPDLAPREMARVYNCIPQDAFIQGSETWHRAGEDLITSCRMFHFTARARKPWDDPRSFPTFLVKYFTRRWERHAVDTLSADDLSRSFPRLARKLSRRHLRFYWYPERNVGDCLTPYFLSKFAVAEHTHPPFSERDIHRTERHLKMWAPLRSLLPRRRKAARYVVSTGSLARLCGPHALVFGSGIRSSEQRVERAMIRFVRGPLTRDRYLARGIECPAICGDPGMLLPRIYRPEVERRYRLGIIPHFTEAKQISAAAPKHDDVLVLDTNTDDVEGFLTRLLSCRATVSSSLHGVIFSHAYRIPTRHVIMSDGVFGDGTKFRDHYAAVGLALRSLDLRGKALDADALFAAADEIVTGFDDRLLWDEMFFGTDGLKPSLQLPY